MAMLLGLDCGLTVTKAVLFDETGRELAVARRRVPQEIPEPHHVERDMETLWTATAEAISEIVGQVPSARDGIAGIAATAHGDGLYLLDAELRPLGPGILSLDSRAEPCVQAWRDAGLLDRSLALTGQHPHASAPSALLHWMRQHAPDRFARIAHVLACKDWIRFCLTGTVGTDLTEASTAFTDVRSQSYSTEALDLYGLGALAAALPEVANPDDIVGHVTAEAARRTGLREGTPVAAGLHDVTASALGIGGQRLGAVDVVAGTYSINEVVSEAPRTDPRWFCRNGLRPGLWNNMSISPASSANYDWFLDRFCAAEREADGDAIHDRLGAELRAALDRPSTLLFHPFLFGSPLGATASGGFFGLRGWQDRGDLLRAVLEGVAFNHRFHVDALRDGFPVEALRLTGGISRNPDFAQMMADVTGLPVTTSRVGEAAAWGAALCAGAAAGLFASPYDDPRASDAPAGRYLPDVARHAEYDRRYAVHDELTRALGPVWPKLNALADPLGDS